ncbi:putative PEP-binding protein [Mycoplasmopsis primatum]|uniref:putative PEP-binding protein n=1 Tax=Mycoplasmopsis primatum TaxID=55604 RepID=UPI000494F5CE|nr:putative PEP-binding protein [Mycoplasmopsis primatum]
MTQKKKVITSDNVLLEIGNSFDLENINNLLNLKNQYVDSLLISADGIEHETLKSFYQEVAPTTRGYKTLYKLYDTKESINLSGIRSLDHNKQLFIDQISAILENNVNEKLYIVIPYVSTIDEFVEVKELIDLLVVTTDSKNDRKDIKIGFSVDNASAALHCHRICNYADFVIINSDNLLANSLVIDQNSKLFNYNNPSFINLLKIATQGAKIHQKFCGLYGSILNSPKFLPLIIGLDINQIYVPFNNVDNYCKIINKIPKKYATQLVENIIYSADTNKKVVDVIQKFNDDL